MEEQVKQKSEGGAKQESAEQEVELTKETKESIQTEEASIVGETSQVEGQDNPAFEEEQK